MSKKPNSRQVKSGKSKAPAPKKPTVDVDALQTELQQCKSEILILRAKFNMDEIKKEMVEEFSPELMYKEAMIKIEAELKQYQEGNGGTDNINDLKQELSNAKNEVETMKVKAKSDNDAINRLQQRYNTLENDYSQMKTEYNNTKGKLLDINDNKSVESILKQKIKDLEAKLKSTEDSLKTHTDKLPDIPSNSSNKEMKNLKAKHDEELKKNSDLSQTLECCKEKLDEVTKERDLKIEKINELNESLRDVESKKSVTENEERLKNELKQKEDSINKLNSQIDKSKEEMTKLKDDHTKQIQDLMQQQRDKSNEEMTKLKDDHTKQIQGLMQQLSENSYKMEQELKQARTQHQASTNHGDQEAHTLKEQLKQEKQAHQETKSKISELENKCHDAFESISKKDKEMKKMETTHKEAISKKDKTINELRREKTMVDPTGGNSRAELNELKKENDQLKTRLSKMAGDQLMNNNPNITDLSDENRPTKLSEKFSELYDNEWTDAYEDEEKESGSEEKAVKSLHKMLLDVHTFCQKESKDHSDRLKKFVRSLPNTESKELPDIPVTKLRQLKEIRKSFATDMVDSVAEKYINTKKSSIAGKPNTEKYIRRCVELCWLMSVQDPPVIINDKLTSGLFDGDLFRTYTKTGKTIDFVVWPPLLLHENGPLLSKGVAQGK